MMRQIQSSPTPVIWQPALLVPQDGLGWAKPYAEDPSDPLAGTPVSDWKMYGPNGGVLAPAGSAPTWNECVIGEDTVNSVVIPYFSGIEDLTTGSKFSLTDDRSVFVVFVPDGIGVTRSVAGQWGASFDGAFLLASESLGNAPYFFANGGFTNTGTVAAANSVPLCVGMVLSAGGTVFDMVASNGTSNLGVACGLSTNGNNFVLGLDEGAHFAKFVGWICEVLVYNRAVSEIERNVIMAYLSEKYSSFAPV